MYTVQGTLFRGVSEGNLNSQSLFIQIENNPTIIFKSMPLQRTRIQIIPNAHAHANRAHAHVFHHPYSRALPLHGGGVQAPPCTPRGGAGGCSNKLTTILKYSGGHLSGEVSPEPLSKTVIKERFKIT